MGSKEFVAAVAIAAALGAGPARGQMGMGDWGEGSDTRPPICRTTVTSFTAPRVWTWEATTGETSRAFVPGLDAPAFINRGVPSVRSTTATFAPATVMGVEIPGGTIESQPLDGGICFGITRLVASWFRRITLPILRDPEMYRAPMGLPPTFGISGISTDNLDDYRLGDYTSFHRSEASRLLRRAASIQAEASLTPRDLITDEHWGDDARRWLSDRLKRDIRRHGTAGVGFWSTPVDGTPTPDDTFNHAVLVVGYEEGTAVDDLGHSVPATRFRVYDPNVLENDDPGLEQNLYLMYLHVADRMSLSPEYADFLRGHFPSVQACGAYLRGTEIHYLDVHTGDDGWDDVLEMMGSDRAAAGDPRDFEP